MAVKPTNCFICKTTWVGAGPICDQCKFNIANAGRPRQPPPPPPVCSYCNGGHVLADCLAYALDLQHQAAMARIYRSAGVQMPPRSRTPFTRTSRQRFTNLRTGPVMKACSKCKGNYIIESKAGSVCSNCHTVVHNPCRNCASTATKGVSGDGVQFIECNDCLFIE